MSERTKFVSLCTMLLILMSVATPATAQTAKMIVQVTGNGSVTIDKDLVVKDPPYASDPVVDANTSLANRTFWVTQWFIAGGMASDRKVELRNPITNLPKKRFVWKDPYGTGNIGDIRGMRVEYDSTNWTVRALDMGDNLIHLYYSGDRQCWKECNGVTLYGSVFHPPCCPTANGGYDCSCTPVYVLKETSSPCCEQECNRPRRHRSILSWLRGCD